MNGRRECRCPRCGETVDVVLEAPGARQREVVITILGQRRPRSSRSARRDAAPSAAGRNNLSPAASPEREFEPSTDSPLGGGPML